MCTVDYTQCFRIRYCVQMDERKWKESLRTFQTGSWWSSNHYFIDEIDSLRGPRGNNNENEASRRIKIEFLVQM